MAFKVDPNDVITCSSRLATIQRHAADIMKLAEDANPEWYIWGLVGAPFAAWYWSYADNMYEHLGQMGEALMDRVEALDCTASAYSDADAAIADALKRLHDLLG